MADAAGAKAKANSWRRQSGGVLGTRAVEAWLASQRAAGRENPNLGRFLEKQMSRGVGLGAGLVNQLGSGKLMMPQQRMMQNMEQAGLGAFARAVYPQSSNLAGLAGLKMQPGQVYMGSAKRVTPSTSVRSVNAGYSSTPGRTEYIPEIVSRALLNLMGRSQTLPAEINEPPPAV